MQPKNLPSPGSGEEHGEDWTTAAMLASGGTDRLRPPPSATGARAATRRSRCSSPGCRASAGSA